MQNYDMLYILTIPQSGLTLTLVLKLRESFTDYTVCLTHIRLIMTNFPDHALTQKCPGWTRNPGEI